MLGVPPEDSAARNGEAKPPAPLEEPAVLVRYDKSQPRQLVESERP
jgi:hypothetical protein